MALTQEELGAIKELRGMGYTNSQIAGFVGAQRTGKTSTVHEQLLGGKTTTPNEPQGKSTLSKVGEFVLPGVQGFGESIGGAIQPFTRSQRGLEQARQTEQDTEGRLVKAFQDARTRGDTESMERLRPQLQNAASSSVADDREINPSLNKSNRQVVGEGLGTAASVIGLGKLPGALGAGTAQTVRQAAIQTGKLGAGFGVVEGTALGMRDNDGIGGIIGKGAFGGIVGGAVGAGLGAATAGMGGALAARQARKLELQRLADNPVSVRMPASEGISASGDLVADRARMARYTTNQVGESVLDKNARTLLRGTETVDEADIVAIKNLVTSPNGKTRAQKMLEHAKNAKGDRSYLSRPSDVVGESVVDYTKALQTANKKAAGQLDDVAIRLKGETFDVATPENSFFDELGRAGVGRSDDGTLLFDGSDFEDIPAVQKLIKNVHARLQKVDDAHDAHRLKRYIDEQVSYGKSAEGISGQAERIIKGLRRQVDTQLDTNYGFYNDVNTEFAQTLNMLDQVYEVMGRKFVPGQEFAELRAGQVARRLLGNSANRSDIMRVLHMMEQEAAKRGATQQDVVLQVVFADILEDVFGTQATTGFSGSTARGVQEGTKKAMGVAGNIATGNFRGAISSGVEAVADRVLGTTEKQLIQALEGLVGGSIR